jgi:NADH-quinone oxidoreductase subunit D
MNVPTNRETVLGSTVADATIILAAVDPCYCCTERMAATVDRKNSEHKLSARDLIRLSCEKTDRLMAETGLKGPSLPEL